MLNKRTNILFEEETWQKLTSIAQKYNTSIGHLVRKAVITLYINPEDKISRQRENALEQIEHIKKNIKYKFSHKEISELIDYGRKYQ